MTTTDVAGLPAEIRAALARARISQEAACAAANIPRSSYYRRDAQPGEWRLGDLVDLLAAAGVGLRLELTPLSRCKGDASGVGDQCAHESGHSGPCES